MPLLLSEQKVIDNDELVKGIIQTVTATNQMYSFLPFEPMASFTKNFSREKLGFNQQDLVSMEDTAHTSVNTTSQTFEEGTTQLTSIIGQVEVNNLINDNASLYNNAVAAQVMSKSRGMGQKYMNYMIHGNANRGYTTSTKYTDSLDALFEQVLTKTDYEKIDAQGERAASVNIVVAGTLYTGTITSGTGANETLTANGVIVAEAVATQASGYKGFDGLEKFVSGNGLDFSTADSKIAVTDLTAADLLERMHGYTMRIQSKGGEIDYITMNGQTLAKYNSAVLRASAPETPMVVKQANGTPMSIQTFMGIPILRNDYIGGSLTGNYNKLGGGYGDMGSTVYMGTFDDGTNSCGIAGLTSATNGGMSVKALGDKHTADVSMTRVRMYAGLVNYCEQGLLKGTL